ncbi:ABC transporter ATP-binding protein [Nitrincola tapanii]|uniref:ABC-type dipeptide transporter n=1 Tax=Nitrincola tapanii TaxID=1708751 RepID=A0A5A9W4X7_9GAMM|nr:ABC transporter ATP-binding protein [Nitrincola tapanii]KAA0875138.1 ABC transporter ATP-binding protein [Nitrincola tapanii]
MSQPLLQVSNLHVNFADKQVVCGVEFSLKPGQCLALVGESGSGKSVTALSILQLLPYPHAQHPKGSILYQGQELLGAAPGDLRQLRGNRISMIFQEPMTSLNPLHTVEKQLTESLLLHRKLNRQQIQQRLLELLDLVGIPQPERRLRQYPHELSGGLRQRVMIAMALANEPELLIADEPTTALDVTIQKQILELLTELRQRLNMAILLITHDLNVVRRYADQVCVLYQGQQIEYQECAKLFAQPQAQYTRDLLAAEPEGRPAAVANDAKTLLDVRQLKVWFPIHAGVLKRIVDHHKAVREASFQLRQGETLGVVGESGSGKTTLALAVLRLLRSEGEIRLQDHRLDQLNQKALLPLRKSIQIVFQDPYGSLSPRMLIGESIAEGLEIHEQLSSTEREARVIEALRDVGLDPETRHRYPHEFSGGQRQRIAIARALVLKPQVIVLDEPTSALDRSVQKQIIELLRALQQRYGLSYLFISHDLAVVRALSHKILVMKEGDVVEQGESEQIFTQAQHPYTRALLEAALG